MTKYIDKTIKKEEVKPKKKTVFKKYVYFNGVCKTQEQPEDWVNVEFIGHDISFGDVFKVWDDDPNDFIIFFGEKGDEDWEAE